MRLPARAWQAIALCGSFTEGGLLKVLMGTAAIVVILVGAAWGISTVLQNISQQKAIEACTPESAKLGLSESTVEFLEERRLRLGGESIAECLARHGQRP
jgi:hypothetical protein